MVNYFFDKIYNLEGRHEWIEIGINSFDKVKAIMKEETRQNVEQLIALNNLTEKLDTDMAFLLLDNGWDEEKKELTREEYDFYYKKMGQAKERKIQLDYVLQNMVQFYDLAHRPINAVIMKPAKFMSKILGIHPLFAVVEEGYFAVLPVSRELFDSFYKEVEELEHQYLFNAFPELKDEIQKKK
jgi:methyltransferase-like protein